MAQVLVRYLCNQFTEIDGQKKSVVWRSFWYLSHGHVTSLSEALERVLDQFPIWRGQNEQSMTLVPVDYGKIKLRRQIMISTSSIGPGATNMITTAGFAHVNRLPLFLIACDVFSSRNQTRFCNKQSITIVQ